MVDTEESEARRALWRMACSELDGLRNENVGLRAESRSLRAENERLRELLDGLVHPARMRMSDDPIQWVGISMAKHAFEAAEKYLDESAFNESVAESKERVAEWPERMVSDVCK